MEIYELKTEISELIEKVDDKNILYIVKTILNKQISSKKKYQKDFWDELPEFVKTEIKEAVKEADTGEIYTHEEVVQGIKEKYNLNL